MTTTIRTIAVAVAVALAVSTGVALASPATTTATDGQTNETASVTFPDQRIDGDSVTIASATLPDGGFAVVYDQQGNRIGHSEYLTPGDHGNLTVSLNQSVESAQVLVVTLYRNNGSDTYDAAADSTAYETDHGADVSTTSYVYFEELSRGTTTASEADGAATTEAAMDEGTDETTDGGSGSTPGFTPITAIAALVGAVLVGRYRN